MTKVKRDDFDAGRPVPALTADELHFAFAFASAVAHGKSPTRDLDEVFRPIRFDDKVYAMRDDVMENQMAAAILESMKHDKSKAKAALWRVMMIGVPAICSKRARKWLKPAEEKDGPGMIHRTFIEAVATVETEFGRSLPIGKVFTLAEKLVPGITDPRNGL